MCLLKFVERCGVMIASSGMPRLHPLGRFHDPTDYTSYSPQLVGLSVIAIGGSGEERGW